ncbi:hypothetical protein [Cyanobium sp. Copco_Reservoir_LC18]|uniref:hypothetical protein n=1 Tax=Cyanobium sp. Copco_Reservoir_LC18 TaxID=1328305 RepID=UPI001F4545D3|nr:hypothetical protein [Cyanobium sp. Copco_Reservoir_LC18]
MIFWVANGLGSALTAVNSGVITGEVTELSAQNSVTASGSRAEVEGAIGAVVEMLSRVGKKKALLRGLLVAQEELAVPESMEGKVARPVVELTVATTQVPEQQVSRSADPRIVAMSDSMSSFTFISRLLLSELRLMLSTITEVPAPTMSNITIKITGSTIVKPAAEMGR